MNREFSWVCEGLRSAVSTLSLIPAQQRPIEAVEVDTEEDDDALDILISESDIVRLANRRGPVWLEEDRFDALQWCRS